ncbi:hypothetical protein BJ878DRAFT_424983, partial [Calycina marina]
YTQGYSQFTLTTHLSRTADFLLPHIKKGEHILDIGCDLGTITTGFWQYATEGTIICIDDSPNFLGKVRSLASEANNPHIRPGSVVFKEGNLLGGLPYPDGIFVIIFASQLFEHSPGTVRLQVTSAVY